MTDYKLVKNLIWATLETEDSTVFIPATWSLKKVQDLSKVTSGGTPSTKDVNFWNKKEIKWLSSGEVSNNIILDTNKYITKLGLEKSSAKLIPAKSVLIALAGQGKTRGQVAMSGVELSTNQSIGSILPSDKFDSLYLYYDLRNRYFELRNISGGDGDRGGLNLDIIKNILVKVPSLPEQTAIASILSQQESVVQTTEQLIAKHEQRLRYLSNELLSGRLRVRDDGGKLVFYKNTQWKTVEVNGDDKDIPEDWEVSNVKLTSICLDSKRKALNSTERGNKKGKYPYWGANCIVDYVDNYLVDEEVVLLGEDAAPFFDKSKHVAFVSNEPIWPNNHIHVLKSKFNSHMLCYILNDVRYEKIISTTDRPKLTQEMMNAIQFAMPLINECTLIPMVLSNQESLIDSLKQSLTKEKQKFQFLLDNLLSGKYLVETV